MTNGQLYTNGTTAHGQGEQAGVENVIIIGSGPAGFTAGLYTARANLSPLLITGNEYGGQVSITYEVENYPGFPESLSGPELVEKMKTQAEKFGCPRRRRSAAPRSRCGFPPSRRALRRRRRAKWRRRPARG